ncbi:MAG: transposase family protein [Anaerolineales bacterium]|nr:transposase family protein [Anaerolineales bacterium]
MGKKLLASIEHHFGNLATPRTGNAKQHKLLDILVIAIRAVICGTDGWNEIELFGKKKKK